MLFKEMPSSWSDNQRCDSIIQSILFPFWADISNNAINSIFQIYLTLNRFAPSGRLRILKVSHVRVCSRIEGIDYHLSIPRGARDFDSSVLQIIWDGRN